jgi:protein-S-isoprenylcysteine O-methyltransferase Ste14
MNGGHPTQAKVIGIFFLIFAPYTALIVKIAISAKSSPPPRWVPLIGLVYMVLGIWACFVLSRKLYNAELGNLSQEQMDQSKRTYGRADFPALTIPIAYISSLAHLEKFSAQP